MHYFDQNLNFIDLGSQLNDTTKLEIGFMEQTVQRPGVNVLENKHTITVCLTSKWPIKF